MIRSIALLGLFASVSWGQYGSLATPYDGTVVYFASVLTLKGTNEPTWGKLFAADQTGVRLVRSLAQVNPAPPGYTSPTCILGNFYNFSSAETTADGTSILSQGSRASAGYCRGSPGTYRVSLLADQQYPYYVRISPDGQHAIADVTQGPFSYAAVAYVDLATGNVTPIKMPAPPTLSSPSFGGGRTIANDGTAIFMLSSPAFFVRPGADPQPFPVANVTLFAIDASGSKVLYGTAATSVDPNGNTYQYGYASLRLFDLHTQEDDLVLTADSSSPILWSTMTDDAQRVLLARGSQVWVVQSDGSGLRQLTNDPAGVVNGTISGNGKVVYAATQAGPLLKINADTGDQVELVGRTPHFDPYYAPGFLTPGVPGTVTVFGLPDVSLGAPSPPPLSLADTTITIAGLPAPVLFVVPTHIDFLVPWNVVPPTLGQPLPTVSLVVGVAGDNSPFDFPQVQATISAAPTIAAIAHQDWSGPVTSASPPHVGEILHFFMVGLGAAVNPEVQPGAPAPSAEPLARLATPMVCADWSALYAGLAPGDTWRVYQIDLKLGSQTGEVTTTCSLDGGKTWFAMPYFNVAP